MGRLIQIHDVHEDVHRELKRRAKLEGMSLSAYLREELERSAATPRVEEVLAEIRGLAPVKLAEFPAETIRKIREDGE